VDAQGFAVRLRISCEDPDVTEEVAHDLPQWEHVSEDPDGADSIDPGVWGFVVEQLVALAGPLVAYLALRASSSRKPIKVEGGQRIIFEIKPDATEDDKAALVQLLAEYGEIHPK
jgi:hypothetical protein